MDARPAMQVSLPCNVAWPASCLPSLSEQALHMYSVRSAVKLSMPMVLMKVDVHPASNDWTTFGFICMRAGSQDFAFQLELGERCPPIACVKPVEIEWPPSADATEQVLA